MEVCDIKRVFVLQEEVPTVMSSRPQTGLSFLAPEPEDLEDLFTRYKVSYSLPMVSTEPRDWTKSRFPGWVPDAHVSCVSVCFYFQKLQQELEFLEVQEEYIKDEQKNLKKEFLHAQEEVKRIQSIPLVIGQFLEAVDQNTAIVGSTTGNRDRLYASLAAVSRSLGNALLWSRHGADFGPARN